MKKKQVLAMLLALSMVTSMNPVAVDAAEGTTYKDGTYTETVQVTPNGDADFDAYSLSVVVEIKDGKITSVTLPNDETNLDIDDKDWDYVQKALEGNKDRNGTIIETGVKEQIKKNNGVDGVDTVSKATCSSNAIIEAVKSVLEEAKVDDGNGGTSKPEGGNTETPSTPENGNTTPSTPSDGENTETGYYVLMNIPYSAFYSAEGVSKVDTVTSATVKTYNKTKAAGSYHANYIDEDAKSGDEEILGVTYPVYVEDLSVLENCKVITDETTETLTYASGKSGTVKSEVTGVDVLFGSGDYAYYVMSTKPTSYKTLTVDENGNFTFSAASATAVKGTADVTVKYACHYTNLEFIVESEEVTNAAAMNAIILTTSDGATYPLRHVENEWDRTDLGWNWTDLDGYGLAGKTITNVKYYLLTSEGEYKIYSYDMNVTIKQNAGTVAAEFDNANTITLINLPTDIQNAKATVKTKVGRGETAVAIAEDVAVVNNTITTTDVAEEKDYVITITSDNYGDISITSNYSKSGYVLMNIPYSAFYAAEGVTEVDTVTSATVKTYNKTKAAGSYHANYIDEDAKSGDEEILGVTYPVYVEDLTVLAEYTKITDATTETLTYASGKSGTVESEAIGKDVLFGSGDYAYYKLKEEPTSYKTLTVDADGNFTFSAASATVVKGTADITVKYACNYTNLEFIVDSDEVTNAAAMNAIILTTSDGATYPLRHVENEWDRTDLGWNWTDLDGNGLAGKTITNVKYYLLNADGEYEIYSYDVEVTIKQNPGTVKAAFDDVNIITLTDLPADLQNAKATVKTKVGRGETAVVIAEDVAVVNNTIITTEAAEAGDYVITITSDNYGDISINAHIAVPGYVLMNIPYAEFYAAEGVTEVDTVTSATVKTYNKTKAAGSYHANYIDEDAQSGDEEILGVTYPVYVEDLSTLASYTKITDETTETLTYASGKSGTVESEATGKDVLFGSGNYAYYVLAEEPTSYKTLTVGADGNFTFSEVSATAKEGTADITVKYACNYTDLEFIVDSDEVTNAAAMNAIILTTSDGETYPLRHVENEWDRTDLGWNWTDLDGNGLAGKTITNVKYYLLNAEGEYEVYSYNVDVTIKLNAGTVEASFENEKTITLTDLPTDIINATATVKTKVGRGEIATVIAEDVKVENGKIITTDAAEADTTYVITIISDNYGDISINATYTVVEAEVPDDGTSKDDTTTGGTSKDDTTTGGTSKDDTTTGGSSTDGTTTSTDKKTDSTGTTTKTSSSTVKTGDTSNVFVWAGAMFIAMAGAVVMFLGKFNKRRS